MKETVEAPHGARLAYEIAGPDGAPGVVFLNSIGCDRRMWADVCAVLSVRFRCVTFDARGHGDSEASPGDYTVAQLGADALAVLDGAGLTRAHLCGLSLGGLIAQWLSIHAPARVQSVTLANTAGRIGAPEAWEARRSTVLADGLGAIADLAMERFFSKEFRRTHPRRVLDQRKQLLETSPVGYAGCCAALRDADLRLDLERIAAPTLVIAGRHDVSTPPDQAEALARAVRGANLVVLATGHLSNVEDPTGFARALTAHLETH